MMNNIKDHYNELYSINNKISKKEQRYADYIVSKILKYIDPVDKKVLDICCGKGQYSNAFAKLGFIVDAIDISKKAINTKQLHNNVQFNSYDINKIKISKNYDIIFIRGFSGFNTHDINSVVLLCNRLTDNLSKNGYLIIGWDSNFSGFEFNNDTANWTLNEINYLKEELYTKYNSLYYIDTFLRKWYRLIFKKKRYFYLICR